MILKISSPKARLPLIQTGPITHQVSGAHGFEKKKKKKAQYPDHLVLHHNPSQIYIQDQPLPPPPLEPRLKYKLAYVGSRADGTGLRRDHDSTGSRDRGAAERCGCVWLVFDHPLVFTINQQLLFSGLCLGLFCCFNGSCCSCCS